MGQAVLRHPAWPYSENQTVEGMSRASPKTVLSQLDWNFDNVPDSELVACCYWEYARESAFIQDVRRRCLDPKWKEMVNSELSSYVGDDIEEIQSMGYPSEVIVSGLFCPPDGVLDDAPALRLGEVHQITGAFPRPWQSLTHAEKTYRKHIGSDVERIPLVPFERGISLDAKDILDWVKTQRQKAEAAREQVKRENPNLNEETLLRLGKLRFPAIPPSVYWVGGREVTVVAINWGSFTNDEIANYFRRWVKTNRPQDYPVPTRQGHKLKDWRAQLTRLAAMRLLSHFTALQLVADDRFPEIWKTKQFSGRKWGDVTKWHDARREARDTFLKLFPFLPKGELPLSWKRRAPGK